MLSRDTVRIFVLYTFWVLAHYLASHFYARQCTPYNVQGFFMSPLMAPAAHCTAMRWMISHGGNTLCGGWLFFGSMMLDVLSIKHR